MSSSLEFLASSCFVDGDYSSAFFLSSTTSTVFEANSICRQVLDGQLASVHNFDENQILSDLLENSGGIGLLGLLDNGFVTTRNVSRAVARFSWIDNSSFDFGTFAREFPWQEDQPDDGDGFLTESCVVALFEDGDAVWRDVSCIFVQNFICKSKCPENEANLEVTVIFAISGASLVGFILMLLALLKLRKCRSSGMNNVQVEFPQEKKLMRKPSALKLSVRRVRLSRDLSYFDSTYRQIPRYSLGSSSVTTYRSSIHSKSLKMKPEASKDIIETMI